MANRLAIPATAAGFGSVFTLYFLIGSVNSYTDLLRNDNRLDVAFRKGLVRSGILVHPTALKRNHINASHSIADIDRTIEVPEDVLKNIQNSF